MLKSLFGVDVVEVELPEWIGLILHSEDDLLKGAGHKYIRRVPTGNPKKPWRYFYKVSGGEGLGHHSEFIEGAAFKVAHNGKEGHFHILGVDGDKLRIKHDESGEESTLTKDALTSLLHKEHAQAISEHKGRLKKELVAVAKHGSEKQKAKIQSEAAKAGVSEDKPQDRILVDYRGLKPVDAARKNLVFADRQLATQSARHSFAENILGRLPKKDWPKIYREAGHEIEIEPASLRLAEKLASKIPDDFVDRALRERDMVARSREERGKTSPAADARLAEEAAKHQAIKNRFTEAKDGPDRHNIFTDLERSTPKTVLDQVYPKNERMRDFAAWAAKDARAYRGFQDNELEDGTEAYADGQSGIVILKDPDQAKTYHVYLPGKSSGEYGQIASVPSIGAAKDLVSDLAGIADFRKDNMSTIKDDQLLAVASKVHPNLQGAAQLMGAFRHGGDVKAGLKTVVNEILAPFGIGV